MAADEILVLGATGPAGICLLRELLHRNQATIAYVRNPSKIPTELASSPLLKIVNGEITPAATLCSAMSTCKAVLSLLGPQITDGRNSAFDPTTFSTAYAEVIFPAMRKNNIRRIFAMGTLTIVQPDDKWSSFHLVVRLFMKMFSGRVNNAMQLIKATFERATSTSKDIDWTVFRIAQISGEADEASWEGDREEWPVFSGSIADKGWTTSIKRAALTRWIAEMALDEKAGAVWIGKMPAVSKAA